MKLNRGFTIVELTVALLLTGLLMTGLAQVFKSTVSSFYQSGDSLSTQRRNRWAFGQLEDDLRMIGHTDGFKDLPKSVTQTPFRIVPNGNNDNAKDSVEFFSNLVVEDCTLQADIAADSSTMTVRPVGKSSSDAKRGDWFLLRDGMHTEKGFFADAPNGTGIVNLMSEEDVQTTPGAMSGLMDVAAPRFRHPHLTGASILVLRPMQMVHYSIQEMRMDPASVETIPCLVRRLVDASPSGNEINWSAITPTLVCENVSGLRVDLSVDGGTTWTRANSNDWNAMVTKANACLPANNQIDNSFWFKRISILLRVELKTRSATQRTEYSQGGNALAYKERSMVMMIAPRNCGLP